MVKVKENIHFPILMFDVKGNWSSWPVQYLQDFIYCVVSTWRVDYTGVPFKVDRKCFNCYGRQWIRMNCKQNKTCFVFLAVFDRIQRNLMSFPGLPHILCCKRLKLCYPKWIEYISASTRFIRIILVFFAGVHCLQVLTACFFSCFVYKLCFSWAVSHKWTVREHALRRGC